MQFRKMLPLALALTIATASTAGAANIQTAKIDIPNAIVSQVRQQLIRKLLDKFDFSACLPDWDIPSLRPDNTPEQPEEIPDNTPEQPEETPDNTPEQPEETPDNTPEQPEETPDNTPEQPEETPDNTPEQPEEIPDNTPEQPEEIPDNTPQLPDNNQPEGDTEQSPEQDNSIPQGDFTAQVVALVNAERAKYGLSALKVDAKVQQAALVRAKETAQSFSHTRPDGSSFSTALTQAGVSYRTAGENIAYGQSTPQQVMNAWMNSSGHRANILKANYTTIGVGYTVINGTAYWTQLFTS